MEISTIVKTLLIAQLCAFSNSSVRLYEQANFEGLMAELTPTPNCQTLPVKARGRAWSLKTDECIIVHENDRCYHDHIKLDPGSYNLYQVVQFPNLRFSQRIRAIQKCSESYGGRKTHIRFYFNGYIWELNDLRERVKIPTYAQYPIQLWNYGNCVEVECSSLNPTYNGKIRIEGGRSLFTLFTQHVAGLGDYGIIRFDYISPCKRVETCIPELKATVTGFKVSLPSSGKKSSTSDLALGSTSTFINDGWATVSQEYTALKTITEFSEVTLVRSATKMSSSSIQAGVEAEFGGGVPSVVFAKVKASLSTAYSEGSSSTIGNSNRVYHEEKTVFSVNQKIEIEPCTKYKVDSFVRMIEDFPLDYTLISEITGTNCSRPLTASQIKAQLGNLSYYKENDNQTVISSEQGTILFNFGVESFIDGKGEIIKSCLVDSKKVSSKLLTAKMLNMTV